jgi:HPt (histidine-containing phosphotransfer) domain-containing protein
MTANALTKKSHDIPSETVLNNCLSTPETTAKICNLDYLLDVTRGNKKIIDNIVSVFFIETKIEMNDLDSAIKKRNYAAISNIAHKIKSAFSILGITALENVFKEMEQLSFSRSSIGYIELLNSRVNIVFNQAKEEMMPEY